MRELEAATANEDASSDELRSLQADIAELQEDVAFLEGRVRDLENELKAYT